MSTNESEIIDFPEYTPYRVKFPNSAIARADNYISEAIYHMMNGNMAVAKERAEMAQSALNFAGNSMYKLRDAAEIARDELDSQTNNLEDKQSREFAAKQLKEVNYALEHSAGPGID